MVCGKNMIFRKVGSALNLLGKILRRWIIGVRNHGYLLRRIESQLVNLNAIEEMEKLISIGGRWEVPQPYRSSCSFEKEFLASAELVDWLDNFVFEYGINTYLEMERPYFRCIQYWHDKPLVNQSSPIETQYYHVDGDADGNVKIFLLLHETSFMNGPTQAIQPSSLNVVSILRLPIRKKVFGRISDDDLEELNLGNSIISHIGVRGDILLADTSSIYHRGLSPNEERKIIMIQFTDHNIHVPMDYTAGCLLAKPPKHFMLYAR